MHRFETGRLSDITSAVLLIAQVLKNMYIMNLAEIINEMLSIQTCPNNKKYTPKQ